MSTYLKSYGDLFKKAKKEGKYKIFAFDIKSSKVHFAKDKEKYYDSINNFLNDLTEYLLKLEVETNKKILHRHLEAKDVINYKKKEKLEDVVVLTVSEEERKNISLTKKLERYDQINPIFWLGDAMSFIINKDSLSDKQVLEIIQKSKDKNIPNYDLYFDSALYQTDVWKDSNKELSRIYCLAILNEIVKESGKIITTQNKEQNIR